MSLTTVLSNTTSNNLKSTTASTLKSAASAADTSTATTGFSDMLAQSALSTVPSKTLGPETLTGTVQSTTIQTSDYVFDPLGVVGIVPESNSFLQAIRQMMGKPLETPVAQAPAADAPTPVAPPALATFGALPAATPALPVAAASAISTQTVTSAAIPPETSTSSVSDFISTIEAQLNYQASSTSAAASVSAESALVNALDKEPEPA